MIAKEIYTSAYQKAISRSLLILLGIILLYLAILQLLMGDFYIVVETIRPTLPYMAVMLLIFTFQISLFVYIRIITKELQNNFQMAVSSGVNGVVMLLCCTHHLVDILPFLGVGLSFWTSKYQITFIYLGILSSLFGVYLFLRSIERNRLYDLTNVNVAMFLRLLTLKSSVFILLALGSLAIILSII